MPRTTRQYLQRFADETLNNLERASSDLQHMANMYGDIKPEHRDFCLGLVTALAQLYKLLSDFRKQHM